MGGAGKDLSYQYEEKELRATPTSRQGLQSPLPCTLEMSAYSIWLIPDQPSKQSHLLIEDQPI